ncbi:MAG: sugar ABC transporter permease [Elusimicrobiaceae bacterium]
MTLYEHIREGFHKNIRQYTMVMALVLIWVALTLFTDGVFLSPRNISNLFLQTVTVGIVACGMTLIIVTGNIDLSVGAVAGFAGAVAAVLQVNYGWGTVPSVLAALAAGLLIGAWHGFWVAYRKVPAFIVTLASMLAFRGAILGVTGGATISPLRDSFKAIGTNYVSPFFSGLIAALCVLGFVAVQLRMRKRRMAYGFPVLPLSAETLKLSVQAVVLAAAFSIMIFNQGIPYAVLLLLALALAFGFMAQRTVFGRRLYAIGGNAEAAKLSGINIDRTLMKMFMLSGVITAVAGTVMTARLNAATTSAGVNMELDAIAACVIGGTSLMGGEGTIVGALIGALIMSSLDNGMSLMNLDITYQYVVKGLILLIAVWVDISTRRK